MKKNFRAPLAPPYVWPVAVDPWQLSGPGGQGGGGGGEGGGESHTRTEETSPRVQQLSRPKEPPPPTQSERVPALSPKSGENQANPPTHPQTPHPRYSINRPISNLLLVIQPFRKCIRDVRVVILGPRPPLPRGSLAVGRCQSSLLRPRSSPLLGLCVRRVSASCPSYLVEPPLAQCQHAPLASIPLHMPTHALVTMATNIQAKCKPRSKTIADIWSTSPSTPKQHRSGPDGPFVSWGNDNLDHHNGCIQPFTTSPP